MKNIFVTSLCLYVFSCFIVTGISEGGNKNGFGKTDIDRMCAKSTSKPKPGIQFNGKKANIEVMQFMPGKYIYPDHGKLFCL